MTSTSTRSRRAIRSCAARSSSLRCAARSRTPRRTRPAFAQRLADVDPRRHHVARGAGCAAGDAQVGARASCRRQRRPFGGLAATRWGEARARVRSAPGRIYEPEGARPDYWRLARALFAAGFRRGDLVHNCFSYHLTPAGSMARDAARTRWVAPCSPAAPARPSSRCRRWPTCAPTATSARRRSSRSFSRRPTSWASRCRR